VTGAIYLGARYLASHKVKTAVLVAAITLMVFIPALTRVLVSDSAAALTARADQTPLVVGAPGSELELVLNALYFHAGQPPVIPWTEYEALTGTGLTDAIPVYTRYRAQGAPIVGTTLDYFEFRNLQLSGGRKVGLLGEAVLGAGVARLRGLSVGDHVISSPETVFDIAGVYPLKMPVVGILEPTGTPDDDAVFVDVRTAWVIEGLGHGHQDLEGSDAAGSVLRREGDTVTANAALVQYAEITPENVQEFHFHGDTSGFPLTAIIAVPPDEKSRTLLRGRYASGEAGVQMVVPGRVLEDLLATVFTVQNYVILGLAVLSIGTVAVIVLVFMLSQQLRRREFMTMGRIGASRSFVAALVASEVGIVLLTSVFLAAALTFLARLWSTQLLLSVISL
jgi:putative ABC transport system permease protein